MVKSLRLMRYALRSRLKSRMRLEAENLVLRQQLNIVTRKLPKRLRLRNSKRLLLVWLYRRFPCVLSAIQIVKPETVIRWHRRGFRACLEASARLRRAAKPHAGRMLVADCESAMRSNNKRFAHPTAPDHSADGSGVSVPELSIPSHTQPLLRNPESPKTNEPTPATELARSTQLRIVFAAMIAYGAVAGQLHARTPSHADCNASI
jgi:hypothetical protein